jgi:hypothetical protein
MEKDFEEVKQINLKEKYGNILINVKNAEPLVLNINQIPKKILESILDESGFQSSDPNAYKMIGLLGEKLINDVVTNIASLNRKK